MTIDKTFLEARQVLAAFEEASGKIFAMGNMLLKVLKNGNKVLTCGNGGSAADALHMSEELVGRYLSNRRSLPSICLNSDATLLTCIANDFGYDEVFARQIQSLALEGDMIVVFSTSGNSRNILRALEEAKTKGITSFLLTGKSGGKAVEFAGEVLQIPSTNGARVQEMHTFVMHMWMDQIEAEFID
jgi:D-sedoheptulose 7-phosphate isomerase